MAISGRRGIAPQWYTLEGQEGDPEPARFKIKPLDSIQLAELLDEVSAGSKRARLTVFVNAFKQGVIAWEGVLDGETQKPMRLVPSNIAKLDPNVLAIVGAEVINLSTFDEDDEKNS